MNRLQELQDKRNADERYLSHREEQELMRLQAEEIQRLRAELESVRAGWDGEIKIAADFKRERDEARSAARDLHRQMSLQWGTMTLAEQNSRKWPWLEEVGDE